MVEGGNKLFNGLVVILLLFNTFFLALIWINISAIR